MRAAAAKAGGKLRYHCDITGQQYVGFTSLRFEVVVANAATLTELRVDTTQYWSAEEVHLLLQAAPALSLLPTRSVIIDRDPQLARAMLRNEPPFQVLRLECLEVGLDNASDVGAFCVLTRRSIEGHFFRVRDILRKWTAAQRIFFLGKGGSEGTFFYFLCAFTSDAIA